MTDEDAKKLEELTPEEEDFLDTVILSDVVYDSIIDQLNFDKSDELYARLIKNVLKRQTRDQIVLTIWNSLSEDQNKHLKDYIAQSSKTAPFLSSESVLMEFAQMYPDLMEKIFANLSDFFKEFIDKYNEFLAL